MPIMSGSFAHNVSMSLEKKECYILQGTDSLCKCILSLSSHICASIAQYKNLLTGVLRIFKKLSIESFYPPSSSTTLTMYIYYSKACFTFFYFPASLRISLYITEWFFFRTCHGPVKSVWPIGLHGTITSLHIFNELSVYYFMHKNCW